MTKAPVDEASAVGPASVANASEAVVDTKVDESGGVAELAGQDGKSQGGKRKVSLKGGLKVIKNSVLGLFTNTSKQNLQKTKKVEKVEKEDTSETAPEPQKEGAEVSGDPPPKEAKDAHAGDGNDGNGGNGGTALEKGDVSDAKESPIREEAPAAEGAPVQVAEGKPDVVETPKEVEPVPEIHLQPDITPTIDETTHEAPSAVADPQPSQGIDVLLEEALRQEPEEEKKRASGESFDTLEDVPQHPDHPEPLEQPEKAEPKDAKESSTENFIEVNPNQ